MFTVLQSLECVAVSVGVNGLTALYSCMPRVPCACGSQVLDLLRELKPAAAAGLALALGTCARDVIS